MAALGLMLVLVVAGIVSYRLLDDAWSDIAKLRAGVEEIVPPSPEQSISPEDLLAAGSNLLLDRLLVAARARSGTAAALAMLDDPPFDVLRANLLIAKGVPECKDVGLSRIDEWYTQP